MDHFSLALLGVIKLREDDPQGAQEEFRKAVAKADTLLRFSPRNFNALEIKGFALCGLTLSGGGNNIAAATDTYATARKLAPHAGSIRDALHFFDALAESDKKGVLATVRAAVTGK